MKIKLLTILMALTMSSVVHASCMRETFGDTVCGQGPCSNNRNGKVFCAAERDGTAVRDQLGEIVCGVGRCVQDILSGLIMCSREPGGNAVRTIDGVKCLGGCEPATPAHCERIIVE
jgi:hypothetical protein